MRSNYVCPNQSVQAQERSPFFGAYRSSPFHAPISAASQVAQIPHVRRWPDRARQEQVPAELPGSGYHRRTWLRCHRPSWRSGQGCFEIADL